MKCTENQHMASKVLLNNLMKKYVLQEQGNTKKKILYKKRKQEIKRSAFS